MFRPIWYWLLALTLMNTFIDNDKNFSHEQHIYTKRQFMKTSKPREWKKFFFSSFEENEIEIRKEKKYRKKNTHQVANVGSKSVTTRIIYNTHVSNLKNKFAIRIRRPF